jgi:hypothetical protein
MMPSARRLRLLMLAVLALVVTVLFFTSHARQSAPRDERTIRDFYHKTLHAMDHQDGHGQVVMDSKGPSSDGTPHIKDKDGDGTVDEDDEQLAREMSDRLRAAEQKAKDLANKKAPLKPDSPSDIVGVGSSAGGQTRKGKSRIDVSKEEDDEQETLDSEEKEVDEVQNTLDAILKKSQGKAYHLLEFPYRGVTMLTVPTSYNHLQVLLPVFEASEGYSPRQIRHYPSPICR